MTETRAIARLPQLEIEIRHKELETENAEIVAITMKATPNFEAVSAWLRPLALMPMTALSPWAMWQQTAYSMWRPWLEMMGSHPPENAPKLEDTRRSDTL
ncbi:MAG: hypothetical protein AAFY56_13120 [Pseudomonadota bacterium]